jgi:hypothetical protein
MEQSWKHPPRYDNLEDHDYNSSNKHKNRSIAKNQISNLLQGHIAFLGHIK